MYVQLDGQILSYETSGSGKPLILLHGNNESLKIFDKATDVLSEKYTVYAIDSRGQGESAKADVYHYKDMANDVINFIEVMNIDKPVIYGFSDGGIIALMIAITRGDLVDKIIISGVNLSPKGLKRSCLSQIKKDYRKDKNPLTKMMLDEPDIRDEELSLINIPTLILEGDNDMVKPSEAKKMNKLIKGSTHKILAGETHGSYVIHSDKIAKLIIDYDKSR